MGQPAGGSARDDALTTGQAAVLLGVSYPTRVSWLEASRIPLHRCGTHRRANRSEILAYRDQAQQPDHEQRLASSITGSCDVAALVGSAATRQTTGAR